MASPTKSARVTRTTRLDATSKTIEDEWNGKLRALLIKLGYADCSARKFHVPGASKPDGAWTFTDPNGGSSLAVFSGKMGAKKAQDAINTAGEYQFNLAKVAKIGAAFGVTYPETKDGEFYLYVLRTQWYAFSSVVKKTLDELAQAIYDVLARKSLPVEPSESLMLRLLNSAVEHVGRSFRPAAVPRLVEVFGQNNPLFESLLGEQKQQASEGEARQAAAYLLVNQLLFYYFLSSFEKLGLPKIDPETIRTETLHSFFFERVLEIDYKPVFEFNIAQNLDSDKGATAIATVVRAFEHVQAQQISSDVIGKIFHNLIPLERRKRVAAFYTNSNAAHLLAHLVVDNEYDRVIDPACGSGTMLVGAYAAKREAYEKVGRKVDLAIHEKFVSEQLTGIDIMPFSGHLAVIHLSLQAPEHILQKVRVAITDSLELSVGDKVQSSRRLFLRAARFKTPNIEAFAQEQAPEVGHEYDFTIENVDAVLMNPPFSDNDRIPRSYKTEIVKRFGGKSEGSGKAEDNANLARLLTGKWSLQLPFLLLAHELLGPAGRIGAVLPITTLTGEAFTPWLRFVLQNYAVRAVIVGFGRTSFSENTALTECLFVAEKGNKSKTGKFALVAVEVPPPQWDDDFIHRMAAAIRGQRNEDFPGLYRIMLADEALLDPARKGLQGLVQTLSPEFSGATDELNAILQLGTITLQELEKSGGLYFQLDALGSKEEEGPMGRGLEYYCAPALIYLSSAEAAKKSTDRFVIQKIDGEKIVVKDRVTGEVFKVPESKTVTFARRLAGVRSIDATSALDRVLKEHYNGVADLFWHVISTTPELPRKMKAKPKDAQGFFLHRLKTKWPKRIAQGRARLWMARKIDLAAPGTSLLAAYSEMEPMIGPSRWVIRCPADLWMEKALALWFNSTLFLLQVLSFRSETRGSYGDINKHRIIQSRVLDFAKFDVADREKLQKLFEAVKDVSLPSILEQLGTRNATRREIDIFFVKKLNPMIKDEHVRLLLDGVYNALVGRLNQMLTAMG